MLQIIRTPDETLKILVEGVSRVRVDKVVMSEGFLEVDIRPVKEIVKAGTEVEALSRSIKERFKEYVRLNKRLPDEVLLSVLNIEEIGRMADSISAYILGRVPLKQELLEEPDLHKRLQRINQILANELDILEVEQRIDGEVQTQVQRNQREFYLNEQLRAIRKELGFTADEDSEIEEYSTRIEDSSMSAEAVDIARREVNRLERMSPMSPEATVVRNYLDTLLALPVEEKIAGPGGHGQGAAAAGRRSLRPEQGQGAHPRIPVGLQADQEDPGHHSLSGRTSGCGQDQLGRSIADSMKKKFVRISLGGVRDEAEIRGHRRTYIGSKPGRIIESLRKAGTRNPVFLLDEIDKMGVDFRGDPVSALLEVLDPEQNSTFSDHYLEVEFDLSNVMFITTANSLHSIPPALEDRMEIIRIPGYLEHEKLVIAEKFLAPRQMKRNGVAKWTGGFKPSAFQAIIDGYTREAGVRNLEREIAGICRKVAKHHADKGKFPGPVSDRNVQNYLGIPKFRRKLVDREPEIGVVVGLAWTMAGGEILEIEVASVPGSGKITITGNLKDVMKESAETALSYARGLCREMSGDWFKKSQIHIHVPEGGIPKDGPSAGVAMATAIVSLLRKVPVRADVAMTGEVTLRGRVLPIGGLPEKAVAAVRAGSKHLIIPRDNEKDYLELSEVVKNKLTVHLVDTMDEVLALALVGGGKKKRAVPGTRRKKTAVKKKTVSRSRKS